MPSNTINGSILPSGLPPVTDLNSAVKGRKEYMNLSKEAAQVALDKEKGTLEAEYIRLDGLKDEKTAGDYIEVLKALQLSGNFAMSYLETVEEGGFLIGVRAVEDTTKALGKIYTEADKLDIANKLAEIYTQAKEGKLNLDDVYDLTQSTALILKDSLNYTNTMKQTLQIVKTVDDLKEFYDTSSEWHDSRIHLMDSIEQTRFKIHQTEEKIDTLKKLTDENPHKPVNTEPSGELIPNRGAKFAADTHLSHDPDTSYSVSREENTVHISGIQGEAVFVFGDKSHVSYDASSFQVNGVAKVGFINLADDDQNLDVSGATFVVDGTLSHNDKINFSHEESYYTITRFNSEYSEVKGADGTDVIIHNVENIQFNEPIAAKGGMNSDSFVSHNNDSGQLHEVYRFFDTKTGDHFYSTSAAEKTNAIANIPTYQYEGAQWSTPEKGAETIDVFRFYDTVHGTHFLTTNAAERDSIIKNQPTYNYEGVAFEAYADAGVAGGLTLERFYNTVTGNHHYSASAGETYGINHGSAGANWIDEGPGFTVHTPTDAMLHL